MSSAIADTAVSTKAVAASDREDRRVSLFTLCLLALGVGIMTGVGAVALRSLIGLIHNLMFNGVFKIPYDVNILGRAGSATGSSCRRSSAASSSSIWSIGSPRRPKATASPR
jgi:hypothetical protein